MAISIVLWAIILLDLPSLQSDDFSVPKLCKALKPNLRHTQYPCGWWFQSTCHQYETVFEETQVCCDGLKETNDSCSVVCSEECRNGGVCVALNTCACRHGLEPPLCDDINECKNDPCPDGFRCLNTIGSFHCSPVPEDGCKQLKCSDHANCTETNNTVSCQCHTGYSGDGVHCHEISCAPLQAPPYGSVVLSEEAKDTGKYGYGTVASFSCNTSYSLLGSDRVHCEYSGSWSSQVPTCKDSCTKTCGPNAFCVVIGTRERCFCGEGFNGNGIICTEINCPDISAPVNGYIEHMDGNKTKDQVHFSCNHGYVPQGDSIRTCKAVRGSNSGNWSGLPPTCQDPCESMNCPVGSVCFLNGSFLNGSSNPNCSCPLGYVDKNNTCTRVDCGPAPPITDGNATHGTNLFGSAVNYECSPGYYQEEQRVVICSSNGTWLGAPPTCKKTACDVTQLAIKNGDVMVRDEFGSLPGVSYVCRPGYTMVGQESSFCLDTGHWSADPPRCTEARCPSMEAIRNGNVSTTGTHPGNQSSFTCNPDYTLKEGAARNCTKAGQWNGNTPFCFPETGRKNCSKPHWMTSSDGVLSFNCSESECVAECAGNHTYQPYGLRKYQCEENSVTPDWVVSSPQGLRSIQLGQCVAPVDPLITLSAETLLAEVPLTTHKSDLLGCIRQHINVTCSSETQLADVRLQFLTTRKRAAGLLVEMGITLSERRDIIYENWEDHRNKTLKQLRDCVTNIESAMEPTDHTWVCGNMSIRWLHEDVVMGSPELTCPPGYSLHTSSCYLCPEGTFFTADRHCEPCPVGFYQSTPGTSECLACPDGTTTEMEGALEKTQCLAFADCNCGKHACVLTDTGYGCQCGLGYTPSGHNQCSDIDECAEHACLGNTHCFNTPGSYICVCEQGYGGEDCVDIDECYLDVCPPDYTCVNTPGSYHCTGNFIIS